MTFTSKSLLTICMLATATLLMTASCKKSNSSPNNGPFTAEVSDTTVRPTLTTAVYSQFYQTFAIAGLVVGTKDTAILNLNFIPSNYTIGVTASSDSNVLYVEYTDANYTYDWVAGNASAGTALLTITAWDTTAKTMSGTFSGHLYNNMPTSAYDTDSVILTNGKFNVTYTLD